jgi:hypothetical protein
MNLPVAGAASEAHLKYYRPAGSIKRAKGGTSSTAFAVFDGCIIFTVNYVANRIPSQLIVLLGGMYGRASWA